MSVSKIFHKRQKKNINVCASKNSCNFGTWEDTFLKLWEKTLGKYLIT